MKKLIYTLAFGFMVFSCMAQKQTGYEQMTREMWQEDLKYLKNKIAKEFNSFDLNVKGIFDREITASLQKLGEMENYQVPGEIQRLLSLLDDGHTELNPAHPTVKYHRVPLSLHIFEGEFRVLATHKEYEQLLGGKVKKIGNLPIDKAFAKLKVNMSRDNEMEYLYAGPFYIILTELLAHLGISNDPLSASFTIETTDGQLVVQEFSGLDRDRYRNGNWTSVLQQSGAETPLYQKVTGKYYWYQYLPESKTIYFNFNRVSNQKGELPIWKFSKKLWAEIDENRPEKLIIDLRMNNGGNYHLTKRIWEGIASRDWLNQEGKVWAITGRRTFSAAATFCVFLKQHTQAQLIGEISRTHPNQADNNEYMTLPNSGFLVEYTTRIKVHWPEMPNTDHIPVDVEITPTFEAYKAGKDLVIEYLLGNN